jgi:hypothetical protein
VKVHHGESHLFYSKLFVNTDTKNIEFKHMYMCPSFKIKSPYQKHKRNDGVQCITVSLTCRGKGFRDASQSPMCETIDGERVFPSYYSK